MSALYVATATAHGGREGRAVSSDGALRVELAIPKEMGGSGRAGATNPEQLFAAGYAACFESAMAFIARQKKVGLTSSSVTAHVSVLPKGNEGFQFGVQLEINLGGLAKE